MIVYVLRISGHRYDLGVKDQGQIYLKYVLPLVKRLLYILTEGVHILHNDCLWFVGETIVSNCQFDCGVLGQGPTALTYYDEHSSYLTQFVS